MAQTIKLKRSATAGNSPTTSQLSLGEIAINTTDGKLFIKRSVSGTESIVEVGGLPLSGGTLTGNLSLGTNNKAIFNSQLEIYGDGSHSYISDVGTGNLIIKGTHLNLRDANNTLYMEALQGGAVTLRHAGNISVATTSTGIDVTGSVVADGLTLGNANYISMQDTGSATPRMFGINSANTTYLGPIDAYAGGDVLYGVSANLNAHRFYTGANTRLNIASNGDISFYDSSGSSQNLYWDSSTSRLGLGTTNPAVPLHVSGTARADIVSVQSELFLGSSSMGKLSQSGSNWVFNTYASGAFGERFRIKDTGVDVSGSVSATGNSVFTGNTNVTGSSTIGSTATPLRTLDSRGSGMAIFGTGSYTEIMLRERSGTTRNVGAWHWSVRGDVGGNNDDLKLLRFTSGSYQGVAMQVASATGNATFTGDVVSQSSLQIFKQSAGAASVLLQRSGATNPWYLAQGNTATNYFEIMEGSTPRFTIANGGNASFSGAVTSTGSNASTSDWVNEGISSKFVINAANRTYGGLVFKDSAVKGAGVGFRYDGSGYKLELGTASSTSSGISTHLTIDRLGAIVTSGHLDVGNNLDVSGSVSSDTFQNASGNLNILSTGNILLKFDSDNNQTNRELNIQSNSGDQLVRITETGAATFNGDVSVPNISVADDIRHTGDSDTYLSFENNYLGMYTNGKNTIALNDGNVNIANGSLMVGATTAPTHKLEVVGNAMLSTSDGFMYLSNVGVGNAGIYVRGIGSNGTLRSHTTTDFRWEVTGGEKMLLNSSGLNVSGSVTANSGGGNASLGSHLDLGDNQLARFGASDDLKLYHTGAHSYIDESGTGNLYIGSNNGAGVYIQGSGETLASFLDDGAVTLYHDNSPKIATTSSGISVTGSVVADGLTVDGGSSSPTHLFTGARAGTLVSIDNESTSTSYGLLTNTASVSANSYPLWVTSNDVNRLTVGGNGDISFYNDSGNQGLFWDSSASYLGLGTTTVNADVHISKTSGAKLWITAQGSNPSDAGSLRFAELNNGNNYFEFKHDGSNNQLNLTSTNGNLVTFDRGNLSTSFSGSVTTGNMTLSGQEIDVSSGDLTLDVAGDITFDADGGDWRFKDAGTTIATYSNVGGSWYITSNSQDGDIVFQGNDGGSTIAALTLDMSNAGAATFNSTVTTNKLTLTKDPVGTYSIEVDGTNTGQPNLIVKQSTSERFRCDNSGNLLVGKTSSGLANSGFEVGQSGQINVTQAGAVVARFNRKTSDGSILELTKDGTTVGSIGSNSGYLFVGGTAGSDAFLSFGASGVRPATSSGAARDGGIDLGSSSNRFKDLYLSGNITMGSTAQINASNAFYLDSDIIHFRRNNEQESARIDSSGNLLVGTTDTFPGGGDTNTGVSLSSTGAVTASRDGDFAARFNRKTSDGEIIGLNKDGSPVGSIGVTSAELAIGGGDANLLFMPSDNAIAPSSTSSGGASDGVLDLGRSARRFKDLYLSGTANVQYAGATDTGIYFNGSFNAVVPYRPDTGVAVDDYLDLGVYSHRWDDIFATNGTIQTSDRNEKQDIESLTEAEERVAIAAKGLLKKFRWKNAVEDKGDDARIHFGIIAQDLQDAFEAEGLDAGRYGMFTSNTWTNEDGEEQTRMGVRYSELLAFIISAI